MNDSKTDLVALTEGNRKEPRGGQAGLGELYDLLVRGLPDYQTSRGFEVRRLAADLDVSYQALYKWFQRESISPRRIMKLVELSHNSKRKLYGFIPLEFDDFWPFMSR